MNLTILIVTMIAGLGAGIATGLAGLSAAAVITPMLVTLLGFNAYEAVGISLASDVLASAVSAFTYYKHKNLDIRNGLIMMISTVIFTMVGSWLGSLVPQTTLGSFSVWITMILGIRFIVKPVMSASSKNQTRTAKQKALLSLACGVLIGLICGFIGAGGGMMMLLVLVSVLGYDLKAAVGTSVFIMTFTALTGALSHFAISGTIQWFPLISSVFFTYLGAMIAARFANKAEPKKLNQVTGVVLFILGVFMLAIKYLG